MRPFRTDHTAEGNTVKVHPLLAREPRRILFAGDWHGNTNYACGRLSSAAAHGADLVIHVGDFGYWSGYEGSAYRLSLEKVCARLALSILWVDGNHEDFSLLAGEPVVDGLTRITEHIWHIPRATRWTWAGLRWGALGGATSVDRRFRAEGTAWWPQEAFTADDVSRWRAGGPVDVVVTHDCPAGVNIPGITYENGVRYWGPEAIDAAEAHRRLLADALTPTTPKLIVHGHYHAYHQTRWEYGTGTSWVVGLDCDGAAPERNTWLVDMVDLRELVDREREGRPWKNR